MSAHNQHAWVLSLEGFPAEHITATMNCIYSQLASYLVYIQIVTIMQTKLK